MKKISLLFLLLWSITYCSAMQSDTLSVRLTLSDPCEEKVAVPSFILAPDVEFELYPNPGKGLFTIEWTAPEPAHQVEIRLYNLHGSVLLSKVFPGKDQTCELDLTSVAPGIYFVSLHREGKETRRKLVIY